MNACASAVTVRIAKLREIARIPARERRIERSTRPCEWSCVSSSCSWSGRRAPSRQQRVGAHGIKHSTRPGREVPHRPLN